MYRFGSFINGEMLVGGGRTSFEVHNPYNQELIGTIDFATLEDANQAVEVAHRVFHDTMKQLPAHERSRILRKAADLIESDSERFAALLSQEAGKPIRDARGEVGRAVQVLRFASEEAKNIVGELIPLDAAVGGENRIGMSKKYPLGVVLAITPFNFPLNLVLHKLAPAFAAGNTVVLKPAEKTPLSSILLAEIFDKAGLPKGALNIVMGTGVALGEPLVTHPLVKKVTFTGSGPVGFKIKEMAGNKKVTLELGSNSPNIIFADANLDLAATSMVKGGFSFAGQACISVQRIYVQTDVYQSFLDKFIPLVETLKVGNPLDETTDVGPMITQDAANRIEAWVDEAVKQGARVLTGGKREGQSYLPTVLVDVEPAMKVVCQEVFAPLVCVIPFETEEEVIAAANNSDYGLQAGVFTKDIDRAFRLADQLETGGVWINEISTVRYDHIPYGGVKQSGIGKEGVKFAIDDMMETKFIGIRLS
ncbi:aldehyde dehydrogenase family protein [Effusibacillus dendaii]|uniref:3-sulfolactaldehyde dehydrogenase n=1 Tax=Effusibacillus dendaii TaxID=2743772 RepID=A0A7I8D875_9BACL|nr:aldehyde dehydrogenase family protein [Effusibacillus dendaii]BCJ86275.1 aldehyde dehydrogenase [Effusibacillus dendaii]